MQNMNSAPTKTEAATAAIAYASPAIDDVWRLYDQTVKYITDSTVMIIAASNISLNLSVGDYFLWGIPKKVHINITHMVNKVNKQT